MTEGPQKILVIDDEPLIVMTIERALDKIGYSVFTARNLKELDEALSESPFDLLITDIFMEEDTVDNIIARVRKRSPMVRIIRMSGSLNAEDAPDFIEKPFRLEDLREKVARTLDESA